MNVEVFKEWFMKILSLVEEVSIIIIDNSPHNSIQTEKIPNISWWKQEIIDRLKGKLIPVPRLSNQTGTYLIQVPHLKDEIDICLM